MNVNRILNAVCKARGVPRKKLLWPSRIGPYAEARFICAYLLRSMMGMSYPEIAAVMERNDHTFAMYGVDQTVQRRRLLLLEAATDIGLALELEESAEQLIQPGVFNG